MSIVSLHLHTEYSLLDGAIKIKELIKFCKENNMPGCAITDHGVMYGAIEFYKQAKNAGINPIVGCEFYVHDGDISEHNSNHNPRYHLVLLAKNLTGYKNLIKLVTISNLEGFYVKPRINHELIKSNSEGLICLSACLGGELNKYILNDDIEKAKETAKWYKEVFGDDYYIELQDHNLSEQKKINPILINIAKELDIEMVITNDSHYLRKGDAKAQDILLCLQTKKDYDDKNRMRFPNDEFYLKTKDELRQVFQWMEEDVFQKCIENTFKISEKCNLEMKLHETLLPDYEVPECYTIPTYLEKLVIDGLTKKYGKITEELEKRYKYELSVINKMGFPAYFLIVWDYINYSKEHNIPVGPGRGSAAGSLISYALGITEVDPMKHNLMFERFLNPDRVSMPDVDVDFCIEKRADVINYVTQKYGEDKVCQIITFGTYAPKAAVKAVARTLKLDFTKSNQLTTLMSAPKAKTIDDFLKACPDFKKEYESSKEIKEIIDIAKSIEGLSCNTGTHAAGIIIAKDPLIETAPLQRGKDGNVVVAYPMTNIDDVGLLKMDFLALKNLTIIQSATNMIKERKGIDLDLNHLTLDDEKVYQLLSNGDTLGVFQLDSDGMKKTVKAMKVSSFEDISVVLALYRPGPLEAKYPDKYINRKFGKEKITYDHPLLETILKDTYGTMVYQEQIMKIVQVLAGFTMGEADKLRKAMGKKKKEIMEEYRPKFLDGAVASGMDRTKANDLYDNMTKFAEYCFNRAHTVCYGYISYQTAFLKIYYPVEYFSALLTYTPEQVDLKKYIQEAKRMGINILPPDINKSQAVFTPDESDIRFGLASIKNVGESFMEDVEKERSKAPFEDMFDFCLRVRNCNKRTLESLIKVGAFSYTGKSRKQLFENIDFVMSEAKKEAKRLDSGQISIFSAFDEPRKIQLLGSEEEFTDKEIQNFEKEFLGIYVTSHPLSNLIDYFPYFTTHSISELKKLEDGEPVMLCGLLTSVMTRLTKEKLDKEGNTKPPEAYKMGKIEDLTAEVEYFIFPKNMQNYGDLLKTDRKVILIGSLKKEERDKDEENTNQENNENVEIKIFVDKVIPVSQANIIYIDFKEKPQYEYLIAFREFLQKYRKDKTEDNEKQKNNNYWKYKKRKQISWGTTPVVFNIDGKQILANPVFWVDLTEDFIQETEQNWNDKLKIKRFPMAEIEEELNENDESTGEYNE